MLNVIKPQLAIIADHFKRVGGVSLRFTTDKRISPNFNPEEVSDMISIYPFQMVHDLTDSDVSYHDSLNISRNLASSGENCATIKTQYESEDGVIEDFDLESSLLDTFNKIRSKKYNYEFFDIIIAIDELYLKTIQDKLQIGALSEESLLNKVANDIIPYIIKYYEIVEKDFTQILDISRGVLNRSPRGKLILRGIIQDMDYSDAENIFVTNGDVSRRKILIALIHYEIINELVRGNGDILRNIDVLLRFLLNRIIGGSKLNKFFDVDTVIRNTFINARNKGSFYDILLSYLIRTTEVDMTTMSGKDNYVIELLSLESEECADDCSYKRLLSSKFLLQYAEAIDIMKAVAWIPKSEIRMYVEGFFASDDDLDYELNVVNDMARRAAICKIDLEYITTKYSKKDALNNAYMCLADIRDARKKLKYKQAIELMDSVSDALQRNIKEAQTTDHKKNRMTINIAYPAGYEG